MTIYEAKEHKNICSEEKQELSWREVPQIHTYRDENAKGLKLNLVLNDRSEPIAKADYIIGVQWLKNQKDIVKVKPKDPNLDFFTILDTCLKDPVVGRHMDQCYSIHTTEPKIPVDKHFSDILNIFLVYHFLKLVEQITQKGLKKGFTKVSENLTAKIRGKILVNETIKSNHTRGRPDKVFCEYQKFTVDCPENQILASTLEAIRKRLKSLGQSFTEWTNLLKQLFPYFEGVQRISLHPGIFKQIKTSRFHRDYNQALDVAEQIYKNVTQTTEVKEETTFIHPFLIDMPELFERYCEAKLRAQYGGLLAGYGHKDPHSETASGAWHLRPDFLLPDKSMILDAKYKFDGNETDKNHRESDYKQMALYAIHEGIRGKLKFLANEHCPKLVLIYPTFLGESEINGNSIEELEEKNDKWRVEGFKNLYKFFLPIPPLKENSE